jgi:dihydropyrimidinase
VTPPVYELAIRGGIVVTPSATLRTDIGISAGRIATIGHVEAARNSVDAAGLLVLPGAVDGHTHLDIALGAASWGGAAEWRAADEMRSADDYFLGTVAAACGGVTTIVDYAKQEGGQSLVATVEARRERARDQAVIDYGFHLMPMDLSEETFTEIPRLIAAGYPSFKIMMEFTDDAQVIRVMRTASEAGGLTMVHCGNTAIDADAARQLAVDGPIPARSYPDAKPIAGELEGVRRALSFAAYTRAPVCLVHISSGAAAASIAEARSHGVPVWAETRPCYLLLTRERYGDASPRHLMYMGYPPLRERDSVDALWAAVRDGTIDTIASDHVGWTIQQKLLGDADFTRLPMGLPSLETQLGALYSEGVGAGRLELRRFVELMSSNPARLLGLYPRKGAIAVGSDADLALVDPELRHMVRSEELHGGAGHDPLEDMSFTGWPVMTIARGEVIARDGAFVGRRGRGQFLMRRAFSSDEARMTAL